MNNKTILLREYLYDILGLMLNIFYIFFILSFFFNNLSYSKEDIE